MYERHPRPRIYRKQYGLRILFVSEIHESVFFGDESGSKYFVSEFVYETFVFVYDPMFHLLVVLEYAGLFSVITHDVVHEAVRHFGSYRSSIFQILHEQAARSFHYVFSNEVERVTVELLHVTFYQLPIGLKYVYCLVVEYVRMFAERLGRVVAVVSYVTYRSSCLVVYGSLGLQRLYKFVCIREYQHGLTYYKQAYSVIYVEVIRGIEVRVHRQRACRIVQFGFS